MLADIVDGEGNARDGEHGGDNTVGGGGGSPWVGGGKVHRHLVDCDCANQAKVDLYKRKNNMGCQMSYVQCSKEKQSFKGESLQQQRPGSYRAMHQ